MPKFAIVLTAGLWTSSLALAEPAGSAIRDDPAALTALRTYLQSTPSNQAWLRDVSMDVDIEASLPKLNKAGKLHALRHISNIGKITYRMVTFQGDNTVKKDVIARYLEAEAKASDGGSMALNTDNYKFKYRGLFGQGDWKLFLFELEPKSKRVGLFQGWLWIHAASGLPVREQGDFVKTPSIFLKKISFIRDYELRDGVAVPKSLETFTDTRGFGRAELTIRFSNYAKKDVPRLASLNELQRTLEPGALRFALFVYFPDTALDPDTEPLPIVAAR